MNVYIYPNFQKDNAYQCTVSIIKILKEIKCNIYIDNIYESLLKKDSDIFYLNYNKIKNNLDYVLAIGGDGTILQCSKMLLDTNIKLVGINTGRLGFMSSIEHDELEIIKKLADKKYKISKRMMIQGNIADKHFEALNDIVINESKSKMCEFTVKADGILVGKYRANGIIFSTPTGSTAYALSAGGPVIHPELNCIELSLICPHSLFARPLIFPDTSKIEVCAKLRDDQKLLINADGENETEFLDEKILNVTKSDYTINIVDFKGSTFFETLNKKLMHPIK